MKLPRLVLTALILLVTGPAFAHEEHNHEAAIEAAPHGGILRNSGEFKAELVLQNDDARLYLYDKALKPLDAKRLVSTLKGELRFPKDKNKREVVFNLKGDSYQARLTGISKVHRYDLHIMLTIDGQPRIGDFGVDNIH